MQPWIMCLLNLHVAVWIVAVATRRRPNFQIGLFLAICGAVYAAQFLNAYGARHWRALGLTQNYFDDRGVFISFLYSLPLLSAAGFQMVRVAAASVRAVQRACRGVLPPTRARRSLTPPPARPPARARPAALRVRHLEQPPHQGQAGGAAHAAPRAAAGGRGGRRSGRRAHRRRRRRQEGQIGGLTLTVVHAHAWRPAGRTAYRDVRVSAHCRSAS